MSTSTQQAGAGMISASLLPEFDQEMANTRKALERVPDGKLDFKPHEKSGTMGWLATHIAVLPQWAEMTLGSDSFDVNPPGGPGFEMPKPGTRAEILELFDRNRDACRSAISRATDAEMMKPWSLLNGGQTIFNMPKI